jgi:hypothetical protein
VYGASGGGASISGGILLATNTIIQGNAATGGPTDTLDGFGGDIHDVSSMARLTDVTIRDNLAGANVGTGALGARSGGMSKTYGELLMTNIAIIGNRATGGSPLGGGLSLTSVQATLSNVTNSGNSAVPASQQREL